jgi:hypothetical protein
MASKDIVLWDMTPYSLLPNEDGGRILGEAHRVTYRKTILFRVTAENLKSRGWSHFMV